MQYIDFMSKIVNAYILSMTVLVSVSYFSHVLLLLVKVPLIVFLHYEMYVDMFVPLSQLIALGKNNIHY